MPRQLDQRPLVRWLGRLRWRPAQDHVATPHVLLDGSYARDYWERIPGAYYTGDSAHIDEDGYVWFVGRAVEIIKIAGHRIGTIEVETPFLKHPAVAEAAVTGRPDPIRAEVISAFIVLKMGHQASGALKQELLDTARRELGPVAVIGISTS